MPKDWNLAKEGAGIKAQLVVLVTRLDKLERHILDSRGSSRQKRRERKRCRRGIHGILLLLLRKG